MNKLKGKVAVVTGASKGIGETIPSGSLANWYALAGVSANPVLTRNGN